MRAEPETRLVQAYQALVKVTDRLHLARGEWHDVRFTRSSALYSPTDCSDV